MANVSSEHSESCWMDFGPVHDAPVMTESHHCDVVVVGAGIAGLSAAYELARLGKKVIVIDRGPIGLGMTARTTAHLASELDDRYSELVRMQGQDTARLYHDSQVAAINRIEAICHEERIAADFARVDGLLVPARPGDLDQLRAEHKACKDIGMEAQWTDRERFTSIGTGPALLFPRQARFHPLKYLAGLAAAATRLGVRLFADTAYADHDESDSKVVIRTEAGPSIHAAAAIFATNSPVNSRISIHTKQRPDRTFAIAGPIPAGSVPDILYWDTLDAYHYVRLQPLNSATDLLIIGGQDRRSGTENDDEHRFSLLEDWAFALFPMLTAISHRWSGQVMEPVDYLPFSGRISGSRRIYIHTGDSGQGITNAVAASLVFAPLIIGQHARFADIFDPARKPASGPAIANYASDQAEVIASVAGHVTPSEISSVEEIPPGEGAVLRNGTMAKQAIYRSPSGELLHLSAACTHAGCIVHWNSFEKCWDCPCHGSQFAADGEVLNGPAVTPLQRMSG